ncbi:hypothetical protein Leryth_003559 [Lithospermum erythrorhizon]|nr:hypothetical protein Leryth_003559 [Lithospermum erythrorhizon]
MPPYSNTTTTMNHRSATTSQPSFTTLHPDIIQSHILNKLDGTSLASTSCVSTELNNLINAENLWKNCCSNQWPSSLDPLVQPHITNHRFFFSDASSSVHNLHLGHPVGDVLCSSQSPKMKNLISAVDIFYEDKLIFSRVIATESSASWLSCSPFKIDILEPKEVFPTSVKITGDDRNCMAEMEKSLKLSWILIDGDSNRALNVSSMCPVSVCRHWLTGDIKVKYATVVPDRRNRDGGEALMQCGVVVSCKEGEEMHVKEVSLLVEDDEGLVLYGNEGLEIVQEVIKGERSVKNSNEERKRYEKFDKLKSDLSEMKERKEHRLDTIVVFSGVSVFLSLCMLFLST